MVEPIWNKGKLWEVNEYNKRLSEENKILEEIDKKRKELDDDEERRINEVWK